MSYAPRGGAILPISLQKLHPSISEFERRGKEERLEALIAREKKLYLKSPGRALDHLREKVADHVEGPDGIAADVARLIDTFAAETPDRSDHTLVLLGRAGALYPFFRSSALLKHIAGRTLNIPVVLLYPGERRDTTALSFMGELDPDRDYRPRIYP